MLVLRLLLQTSTKYIYVYCDFPTFIWHDNTICKLEADSLVLLNANSLLYTVHGAFKKKKYSIMKLFF